MLAYADEKYTAENTQPTKYTALSPGTEVQLIAGDTESTSKGMSKAVNQHRSLVFLSVFLTRVVLEMRAAPLLAVDTRTYPHTYADVC